MPHLNSTAVIYKRLRDIGLVTASILGVLVVIHLTARWLFASVGFFSNEQWSSGYVVPWDAPYEVPLQPWYHLYFKPEWFTQFTDEADLIFISHFAAVLVLWGLGLIVRFLYWLFLQPESKEVVIPEEMADCSDPDCRCDNHHHPRPDAFRDGTWEYTASCRNPECICIDHEADDEGDTYAPELNAQLG